MSQDIERKIADVTERIRSAAKKLVNDDMKDVASGDVCYAAHEIALCYADVGADILCDYSNIALKTLDSCECGKLHHNERENLRLGREMLSQVLLNLSVAAKLCVMGNNDTIRETLAECKRAASKGGFQFIDLLSLVETERRDRLGGEA